MLFLLFIYFVFGLNFFFKIFLRYFYSFILIFVYVWRFCFNFFFIIVIVVIGSVNLNPWPWWLQQQYLFTFGYFFILFLLNSCDLFTNITIHYILMTLYKKNKRKKILYRNLIMIKYIFCERLLRLIELKYNLFI